MAHFWFQKHSSPPRWWKSIYTPRTIGVGVFVIMWILLFFGISRIWWIYTAAKDTDVEHILEHRLFLWASAASRDMEVAQAARAVSDVWVAYIQDLIQDVDDQEALRTLLQVIRERGMKERLPWRDISESWGDTVWNAMWDTIGETISLIREAAYFEEDIVSLLWFYAPQTYLVALQNTAESRPNGGFFWSFAIVKVAKWKIISTEIRDSYILDYEPDERETQQGQRGDADARAISIPWPSRLANFLPHTDIHFVWANKIWFTYQDGAHIKKLYEKKYPTEQIRWVVFLRSDMLKELDPTIEKKLRERQFTNAATDLIRWVQRFGKKEAYLAWVDAIVSDHRQSLALATIKRLPELLEKRLINLYIPDISVSGGVRGWGLKEWLTQQKLTTRHNADEIYLRESNLSYNKSDQFLTKQLTITHDATWQILFDDVIPSGIVDIGDIDYIAAFDTDQTYTFEMRYVLWVAHEYQEYMRDLEYEYDIQLTERETHILALEPSWQARGLAYFPSTREILTVTWDVSDAVVFETPIPTSSASYMVDIDHNRSSASVVFHVNVK